MLVLSLLGRGVLGVARGSRRGAYVEAVPAGAVVEGRRGPVLVAAAHHIGAGEHNAVVATGSRRGLGTRVAVVLYEAVAVRRGALVHQQHVAGRILDGQAVGGVVVYLQVLLRTVDVGTVPGTHIASLRDDYAAVDIEVAAGIGSRVEAHLLTLDNDEAAVNGGVAVAVDSVVAARVAPQLAAVDFQVAGSVEGVVVGVGLNHAAVNKQAVLALDSLAVGVAAGLRAVGAHMTAVEVDVALNLYALGQALEIVGSAAAAPGAATAANSVDRRAAGLHVEVYQVVVGTHTAHHQLAVGFQAAATLAGAAGVDMATVDDDVAVGTDTGAGVAVDGAGTGAANSHSGTGRGKHGVAAVEDDVVVARQAAPAGVRGGTVHRQIAAVDDNVAHRALLGVAGLDAGAIREVVACLVGRRRVDDHTARGGDIHRAAVHHKVIVALDALLGIGAHGDSGSAAVYHHSALALQAVGIRRPDIHEARALHRQHTLAIHHRLVGIAVGVVKAVQRALHQVQHCVLVLVYIDGRHAVRGKAHTVEAQYHRRAQLVEQQPAVAARAAEVVHHVAERGGVRLHRDMAAVGGNHYAVVGIGVGHRRRGAVPHDAYHARGVDRCRVADNGGVAVAHHGEGEAVNLRGMAAPGGVGVVHRHILGTVGLDTVDAGRGCLEHHAACKMGPHHARHGLRRGRNEQ